MSTTYFAMVVDKTVPTLIGQASSADELVEIIDEFFAAQGKFLERDKDVAAIHDVAKKLRKTGDEKPVALRFRLATGEDEFQMVNVFIQGR